MEALNSKEIDHREFVYFKQLGFSIAPRMVPRPDGFPLALNWFERKRLLKSLESSHYHLASLKELIDAFDYSWKSEFREVAISMIDTIEGTDDIICVPIDNLGNYPRFIEPRPQRGEYPLLIQRADEEKRGSDEFIKGGERIEVPEFPTRSVKLGEDIKILGLTKGTKIHYSDIYDSKYRGVKNLIRGKMHIKPKNRYVLAAFSPHRKFEKIGFRLCSDKPTNNVVIRKFTLDYYF